MIPTTKRYVLILLTGIVLLTGACAGSVSANPEPTEQALETPEPSPTPNWKLPSGTDITVALPEGDAERGVKVVAQYGCLACHKVAPTGPLWAASEELPSIGMRGDIRIQQKDYTGTATTAEQYLFESIVLPEMFVVEGFTEGLMPTVFGNTITLQQMADLIAYLLAFES
ncbi:MAG: c-type cytochrome [Anaerolineae bacterium]|nr:c-type cytochrome [Anaerolineae bacterium]